MTACGRGAAGGSAEDGAGLRLALRKVLGGSGNGAEIVTRGRGYELRLGEGELDVRRFERLLAQGSPREALALWRGPPFDDVASEPFAALEIRRLDRDADQRLARDAEPPAAA